MLFKRKSPASEPSGERASWFIKLGAVGALLFLHIPLALIFLYAFTTETAAYTFPPPGLTLKWFPQAIANPDMLASLQLTVEVAAL
ncbi:MAG: ABC transporter permease, partial [Anaerolineales bacterium]